MAEEISLIRICFTGLILQIPALYYGNESDFEIGTIRRGEYSTDDITL